jgi:hypothetical protein
VGLVRHLECDDRCVLAPESDARKMALAAGLTALTPTDEERRDIQTVSQRKIQGRNQNAGTGVTYDGTLRVDIERRQTLGN